MPERGFYGFSGPAVRAYSSVIGADLPLYYFPFSELSGTTAHNSGTVANTGTYTTGVTLGQGALPQRTGNGAASFAGSSGLTIPSLSLTGDFTVECWAKFSSGPTGSAFCGSTNQVVGNNTSVLAFFNGSGWVNIGHTALTTGVRYHVAFVRKSGVITGYLNGRADGTASDATTLILTVIGSGYNNNQYFNGLLDEFAIWDRALPAARVAAHYAAGI